MGRPGERYTVIMQVWDTTAEQSYLVLSETYGVYRSQAKAQEDAAAAQAAANELLRCRDSTQQLDVAYLVAPCFHPDIEQVLDGLHRILSAPPA